MYFSIEEFTYSSQPILFFIFRIGQLKKAMDIFRVRSSICMAALVFILAAVMAMIGRKQRHDGITVTQIVLERRKQDQEKRE